MKRLVALMIILVNGFFLTACSNPYLFYTGQPVTAKELVTKRIVIKFQPHDYSEYDASPQAVVSRLNDDIYRWGRARLLRSMARDVYVLRVRLYSDDAEAFVNYIKRLNYIGFAGVDHTLRV